MDLTKKVELYYQNHKLKATDTELQSALDNQREFCAIYVSTDLPNNIHNETTDYLMKKYGSDIPFPFEQPPFTPFVIYIPNGLVCRAPPLNISEHGAILGLEPSDLNRSEKYRIGGMFFKPHIAEKVLQDLQERGYEIIKKYNA